MMGSLCSPHPTHSRQVWTALSYTSRSNGCGIVLRIQELTRRRHHSVSSRLLGAIERVVRAIEQGRYVREGAPRGYADADRCRNHDRADEARFLFEGFP